MIGRNTIRIGKFAFQNFFRNVWLSVAAIFVLVLTLLSLNALIALNVLGDSVITAVKNRVDITVHFKPEVPSDRVQAVKSMLLAQREVRDVSVISSAEALQQFSALYKRDTVILESLGAIGTNPFGATLVVTARTLEDYPSIISKLQTPAYASIIDGADYEDRKVVIERIQTVTKRLQTFLAGISMLFVIVTLLIMLTTIRVSIATHREEIAVMRLVGASNWFIRGPFYIEAILWNMCAMVVTIAVLVPGVVLLQPYIDRFFGVAAPNVMNFYQMNALAMFALQFFALTALSLVTTKFATGRYLRI